jgi:hypothetical protein
MAVNIAFKIIKAALSVYANRERLRFIEACKNPKKVQDQLKNKILLNSKLPFPLKAQSYQDFVGNIDNLTHEKVQFFETTSGSTGAKKRIPYTKSLLKSYEKMFVLWVHDLITHSDLKLESGKFFMSISPKIGEQVKDDRQYLSLALRALLSPFLVSNPSSHTAGSTDDFFQQVSLDLLNSPDLEIISIWSPSYFLSFLEFIEANKATLMQRIDSEHIKQLLNNTAISWEKIWPKLKLISCWTEAQAKPSAQLLKNKLGQARIQGKGLLLTEAPITIPWHAAKGNIPLLTETYLEFLTSEGKILGITELKEGSSYTVLTSQNNGFLRYNTLDKVKVTGFYFKTPILEFEGRTGNHSDMVGEKLSEDLIRSIVKANFFFFLVPTENPKPGYEVFVDEELFIKEPQEIENYLLKIHHYKLARDLKQLTAVKTIKIKNLSNMYRKFHLDTGIQLGDIKEKVLFSDLLEAQKFRAWIEKELLSSHQDS